MYGLRYTQIHDQVNRSFRGRDLLESGLILEVSVRLFRCKNCGAKTESAESVDSLERHSR